MVRHLALACADSGIRVNGIILGWFDTDGEHEFYSSNEIAKKASVAIPLRRAGLPEEAARLTCFPASEDCEYMTGSLVRLDGGFAPFIRGPAAHGAASLDRDILHVLSLAF